MEVHNFDRHFRGDNGRISAVAYSGRTREYRHASGFRHRVRGSDDYAAHASRSHSAVSSAAGADRSGAGNFELLDADVFPACCKLAAAFYLAVDWPAYLLCLRPAP